MPAVLPDIYGRGTKHIGEPEPKSGKPNLTIRIHDTTAFQSGSGVIRQYGFGIRRSTEETTHQKEDDMETTIHKQGKLRGEKVQYPDGIGCCVWYPLPPTEGETAEEAEGSGICFDFGGEDLDDFIALLTTLRDAAPDIYVKPEGEEE